MMEEKKRRQEGEGHLIGLAVREGGRERGRIKLATDRLRQTIVAVVDLISFVTLALSDSSSSSVVVTAAAFVLPFVDFPSV